MLLSYVLVGRALLNNLGLSDAITLLEKTLELGLAKHLFELRLAKPFMVGARVA